MSVWTILNQSFKLQKAFACSPTFMASPVKHDTPERPDMLSFLINNDRGATIGSYQRIPEFPLIAAKNKEEEEDCGHHEAENRHEHDPAQRVVWVDMR